MNILWANRLGSQEIGLSVHTLVTQVKIPSEPTVGVICFLKTFMTGYIGP